MLMYRRWIFLGFVAIILPQLNRPVEAQTVQELQQQRLKQQREQQREEEQERKKQDALVSKIKGDFLDVGLRVIRSYMKQGLKLKELDNSSAKEFRRRFLSGSLYTVRDRYINENPAGYNPVEQSYECSKVLLLEARPVLVVRPEGADYVYIWLRGMSFPPFTRTETCSAAIVTQAFGAFWRDSKRELQYDFPCEANVFETKLEEIKANFNHALKSALEAK